MTPNYNVVVGKQHFENYHYIKDHYNNNNELRKYCETSDDCREFAYVCNRNRCECAKGYRPDERNETCVGGVRTECRYDVDCIENAYCFHQFVCRCKHETRDWRDDLNCPAEWESKAAKLKEIFMMQLLLAFYTTIIFQL